MLLAVIGVNGEEGGYASEGPGFEERVLQSYYGLQAGPLVAGIIAAVLGFLTTVISPGTPSIAICVLISAAAHLTEVNVEKTSMPGLGLFF